MLLRTQRDATVVMCESDRYVLNMVSKQTFARMAATQITFDEEGATGIPSQHAIRSGQIEDKTSWETTTSAVAEAE